ncbi:1-deoxy-D-xylulose-5-phosphate synthase [Pseudomonas asplenii]|uniref:1-deoxy-D-xylulose-5-phosphate synthase n=3 Tax=Pseudomonas asplenii TaxID=53407 RepID=A0A1H6NU99_9PSED|nr:MULTISPECIES: 1-deoxy-D-xylulose-5-phosphate synthase [Pseudomonas]UZE26600.1 1-deoxy-D-xylulose-5-phosphate synthase [Pseudomonas asplenii]SEI20132.1 1-deoxy-D-xylulose-5-phosphate synthase [Pseudomonas fuscovaginae]
MFELLNTIDSPAHLRALHPQALAPLADELRAFILHSVSRTGGHLSANLGSVEIAIALHYVFDTPHDRIVWDVGHQAYPHKILTGRRQAMAGIRQLGGISGFPRRQESEYDSFGTAHAGTSISAILGMAQGARLTGSPRHCVAVIGDGSLSGGMAYEAMNNAGRYADLPLLIVLNDNDLSISPAVGALREHLLRLCTADAPDEPNNLFESLGLNYSGPVDGHDLQALIPILRALKRRRGPQLLHVITQKGHGYSPAASDPVRYHATGTFNAQQGLQASAPGPQSFTQVFGNWLCDEAERDPRVVAITPAMREGSGLVEFERRFPERYFDVGIAEQHALTFAAGLATEGLKPVVAIYSTFLQRAYDQLIHDIAIQNLPVLLAIDRAGLVGADGATHTGAFDIAYLRCIPNLVIMTPADENECRQLLHTGLLHDGPVAVRYPRGTGCGATVETHLSALPIGRGEIRRRSTQLPGHRVAILAFGPLLSVSLEAAQHLDATVANMRYAKPLDMDLIENLASSHDLLVTVEEGCVKGGAGAACLEHLAASLMGKPLLQLGLSDQFIEHATVEQLLHASGLDVEGIVTSIQVFREQIGFRNGQRRPDDGSPIMSPLSNS